MWMYALTTLGSYQKSSHLSLFSLILGFFGFFFGLFACHFAAPAMRQGEDVKALLTSLWAKLRKQNGRPSAILSPSTQGSAPAQTGLLEPEKPLGGAGP